jgi:hypothetical protein
MLNLIAQDIPGTDVVNNGEKIALFIVAMSIITPTWLSWWNSKIAKKEVRPNSGHSMKDKVDRMADQGDRLEAKLDLQGIRLDHHSAKIATVQSDVSTLGGSLAEMQKDIASLQKAQEQRRETIIDEWMTEGKDRRHE